MTGDEDIEGLAAEYVLGSLDAAERAEVAARRQVDPALNAAIRAWEERLGPLNGALAGIEPPPHVLRNVMRQIQDPQRQPSGAAIAGARGHGAARRRLAIAAGACALAACLVAVLVWVTETPVRIPAKFVSELKKNAYATEGTMTATVPLGFEVYFDLRASTILVRPYAVPPGASREYQLWLIPRRSMAAPISLGVIPLAEPSTSPWPATYPPRDLADATLAVSLEPRGGSPKGIPTGPTIFVGKLVQATPPRLVVP
jgi:anti-sigma-K factor RskA